MAPRATPLSPEERRAALVDATLPLLYDHGRAVTTRLIAEAAGVAEGTIFRVFSSKEELIDAALAKAFNPAGTTEALAAIPRDLPLRDRALELVRLMQERFARVFLLMQALGIQRPPDLPADPEHAKRVAETLQAMVEVIEPDQDQLSMPAAVVVRMIRLLAFSGTHPKFTGGDTLTPEQIVDTVLYGAVRRPSSSTSPQGDD